MLSGGSVSVRLHIELQTKEMRKGIEISKRATSLPEVSTSEKMFQPGHHLPC